MMTFHPKKRGQSLFAISALIAASAFTAPIDQAPDGSKSMPAKPLLFDTTDPGENANQAPLLQPWKKVPLEPEFK